MINNLKNTENILAKHYTAGVILKLKNGHWVTTKVGYPSHINTLHQYSVYLFINITKDSFEYFEFTKV